jgi:hypothetical protein
MTTASLTDLVQATVVASHVHHLLTAAGLFITSVTALSTSYDKARVTFHVGGGNESYAVTKRVFRKLKGKAGPWYGATGRCRDGQRNVIAIVDGVEVLWIEHQSTFDKQKRAAAHQKRVKKEQAEDDRAIYVARHGLDEETTR